MPIIKKTTTVPEIKIGEGVSVHCGTDSNAATVIEVSASGRAVTVQYDKAIPTEHHNYYGGQDYTYEVDPKGRTAVFSYRPSANGFVLKGCETRHGISLSRGRRTYQDPHF